MVLTSIALVLLAVSAYSQQILPASYLSPYDSGWNDILAAGPAKVPIALVNPNSGPGAGQYDSHVLAFKALTQRLQAAGIKVFGYSDTSYTRVPVSRVLSEIDKYYAWMGVDGIFLDQTPGDCSLTWYYEQIYDKVKGYGGQALLNPGAPSAECYMAVGDIHLTAEIDYNYYVNGYQTASWVWKYPSTRFYHIAYNVPQSAIKSVVQLARNRNAGYVFFTNLGLPNPYGTLPSYWAAHVSALVLPTPTQTTEAPSSKAPEPTTKAPEPTTKAPMPTTTPPTLPPTQAPAAAATQPPSSATSAPDSPANSTLPPSEAPATEAPLVSRIAAVSNPTFSAQLGAPATVPANELVWQSLVLAVNTPGTYLLLGITSHAAFSLTKQVHIFLSADDAGSPSVTIKGDRAYSASGREIYRLAEPADGTSMTLAVPLSLFSPRPRTIHVYGISAQNGVRIPETGSINVSLPALMAHIFFQYEAPAAAAAADPSALALLADDSNALKDTGAAYSDKVDANGQRLGFSYGWSAEPTADSTEGSCVAFSDRSWQIAVPDSGFYRVRAVLSTPSPGSCVSLSVGDTALGHVCNDGVNTALNPIHERTVLINGDSLMLWQTSNATLPLPADPAQRLCELLVTAASGIVMETTLDTDSADAVNVEVLEAALASLTGETAHRFTVIGHSVNLTSVQTRQDSAPAYGRVTFAYLIADEKLSSSPVPASDLSAKLQAAGETDWANSGPYRSVTSNLVATGSVPASYMPESTGPATPAAPTKGKRSSKTGLVVGLVVGLICAALLVAAAVFVLYPAPIWKRDNRWMHSFLPAALKPTSNPVPVESSDSVAAPTSSSNLASAELGSPINSHTVLV